MCIYIVMYLCIYLFIYLLLYIIHSTHNIIDNTSLLFEAEMAKLQRSARCGQACYGLMLSRFGQRATTSSRISRSRLLASYTCCNGPTIRVSPSEDRHFWKVTQWLETDYHWIGFRENLQETMVFTIKYRAFLNFFPSSNSMRLVSRCCSTLKVQYSHVFSPVPVLHEAPFELVFPEDPS